LKSDRDVQQERLNIVLNPPDPNIEVSLGTGIDNRSGYIENEDHSRSLLPYTVSN
jgi:hypothetical protein